LCGWWGGGGLGRLWEFMKWEIEWMVRLTSNTLWYPMDAIGSLKIWLILTEERQNQPREQTCVLKQGRDWHGLICTHLLRWICLHVKISVRINFKTTHWFFFFHLAEESNLFLFSLHPVSCTRLKYNPLPAGYILFFSPCPLIEWWTEFSAWPWCRNSAEVKSNECAV
jgi:hypothetical protein